MYQNEVGKMQNEGRANFIDITQHLSEHGQQVGVSQLSSEQCGQTMQRRRYRPTNFPLQHTVSK